LKDWVFFAGKNSNLVFFVCVPTFRYNPKAVFMLLQKIKSSDLFERFRDWFHEKRESWKLIDYHDNYMRAEIDRAKKCTELGLCQDIRITRGILAAMSVIPTANGKPDLFLQPLTLEIRWDDLWARNSHPEVDLLLQYFVCDCKGNSDTDPLIGILWHMLSEERKETVNLWNNLCSVPFTDEASIPGYMLREIGNMPFDLILIMFDYLFPEHLYSYMRNGMNNMYKWYKKDMTERQTVL
jgi:hypothetical protein